MKEDKNTVQDTRLEFKQHEQFFETFHYLRDKCTQTMGKAREDEKELKTAIDFIENLFLWTSAQLTSVCDYKEINKKINELYRLNKAQKFNDCYHKLKDLYFELNELHSKCEMIPKVQIEEKDEEMNSLDDKTRYALEAWKLVNAQ